MGGGWGLGSGGGQGRWEQRSEACVKIQKKIYFFFFRGGGAGGGGGGGGGFWLGRVRVDVNGEQKLL